MKPYQSIDPATGKISKSFSFILSDELENVIDKASCAAQSWSHSSFKDRKSLLGDVAEALLEEKENLAELMSFEMGKPIAQGRAEVEKCESVVRYYIENGEKLLQDNVILKEGRQVAKIVYEPVGCVLAIMPWNFPLWQLFRF